MSFLFIPIFPFHPLGAISVRVPDVIASPALEGLIAVGDPPLGGFFRLLVGPDLESGDVLISQFDTDLSAAVVDVVVPIFVAYGVMDNGRTFGLLTKPSDDLVGIDTPLGRNSALPRKIDGEA